MANADVTRLMGELDTANGNTDAVQGMLDMANADVARLMGEALDTANGKPRCRSGHVGHDAKTADVTQAHG